MVPGVRHWVSGGETGCSGPTQDFAGPTQEELEARNWSQVDLAEIMGRPQRLISEIIQGKRAITAETAQQLSKALGTSAEFWLNLENMYRLSKAPVEAKLMAHASG